MADYTHHVVGMSEVIVGMDLGRPGADKTVFVRATYDRDQVIIIDDPLNGHPVTEAQKRKFLKWFEANLKGRYEAALQASFRIPVESQSALTDSLLDDVVRNMVYHPKERKPLPARRVPYYRQNDRQLNGRRR